MSLSNLKNVFKYFRRNLKWANYCDFAPLLVSLINNNSFTNGLIRFSNFTSYDEIIEIDLDLGCQG